MSKILLIGAASGIGSSLATSLLQNSSHSVISVDDLRAERTLHNMQFALSHRKGDRHKFHLTSISDPHICSKIFEIESPDMVIFCKTPEKTHYHQSLVHSLSESQKRGLRFLYIVPQYCPEFSCEQTNYGLEICRSGRAAGYPQILMTCRIFGPRQSHGDPLIKVMSDIIRGDTVDTTNLSSTPQEWIYIKDLLSAVDVAILNPGISEIRAFTGDRASEAEVAEFLTHLPASRNSHIFSSRDRSGDLHNPDWAPKYQPKDALEHTISWYAINDWART